jgi:hypothetical protein
VRQLTTIELENETALQALYSGLCDGETVGLAVEGTAIVTQSVDVERVTSWRMFIDDRYKQLLGRTKHIVQHSRRVGKYSADQQYHLCIRH